MTDQHRYAVDVRLFLATITTAMVIAFGVGVSMGPDGLSTPLFSPPTKNDALQWQTLDDKEVPLEKPKEALPDGDGQVHQPAGQHLLVDIKSVDSDFLDSEERLSKAMVDAVKAGGLTLLSYHCHSLVPAGVSCVGVLLESHISFHTWPEEGVITLDLFTCGPKPLMPLIPKLEELFGVGENPEVQWSHELRGFRHESDPKSPTHHLENDSDLAFWVLSPLDLYQKTEVYNGRTKFQQVDIWDILEQEDTPSYEDALKHNLQEGDPRWLTPEIATPDRLLFLDGTLQSVLDSEHEYHEALVHPGMFAHPNPKNVAILGGGEGATLREVLKHNTLEKVAMIDIDEELIQICRQYLPNMSNCSDLIGRAENCFDDEKAEIIYADGRAWFLDRFGPQAKTSGASKFDIVIVDALDPEDPVAAEFSDDFYSDENFIASLMNSLTEEGVLVIQVGTAPNIHDPRADMGVFRRREILFNIFEEHDQVEAMFPYEEAHCGFNEPHSFLLVCKSAKCRSRWYAESDTVDFEVYSRLVRTHSKNNVLAHYDGSTQHTYKYPPKAWETVYCRREPTPFECDYIHLDPAQKLFEHVVGEPEKSSFEIKENSENDDESLVFAKVDIPKGSYIMPSHLASSFIISDKALDNLRGNTQLEGVGEVKIIEHFLEYIDEYGHESNAPGIGLNYVEVGASYLIRTTEKEEEANVGRWVPPHPSGKRPVYSPVYERHRLSFDVFLVATKDITKGEELLKPKNLWKE